METTNQILTETTKVAASDNSDAAEISSHFDATDDERAAAAHVIAAYDLNTICELADVATVQAAGKRLRLW